METLAERIAQQLLAKEPRIRSLLVRVKKPQVALVGTVDYMGVEIERDRSNALPSTGAAGTSAGKA